MSRINFDLQRRFVAELIARDNAAVDPGFVVGRGLGPPVEERRLRSRWLVVRPRHCGSSNVAFETFELDATSRAASHLCQSHCFVSCSVCEGVCVVADMRTCEIGLGTAKSSREDARAFSSVVWKLYRSSSLVRFCYSDCNRYCVSILYSV